jgi:integrase
MSLYKKPDGDVWWANISHNGERVRFSTGEYSKAAAQRVHDERKAELHRQPKLKGKKWSDACDRWMAVKNPTTEEIASLIHFGRHYSDRLLTSVTPESIDEALSKFCTTAETYNRHRARISGLLHLSKIDIDLDKREAGIKPERMWLRPEQWTRLLAELPEHQKLWARFAVATGLRQANQFGLTWSRVDLARKYCWIERDTAKGKKSFTVPLNEEAINVLKAVQGQHAEFCFTFKGHKVSEIKTAFQKACVRAGLGQVERTRDDDGNETGRNYSGFVWHGLRHTWATWHVQNGTPLDVLQRLGAWSDYRMVLIYAHHAPEYLAGFAGNSAPKEPKEPSDDE